MDTSVHFKRQGKAYVTTIGAYTYTANNNGSKLMGATPWSVIVQRRCEGLLLSIGSVTQLRTLTMVRSVISHHAVGDKTLMEAELAARNDDLDRTRAELIERWPWINPDHPTLS